MNDTRVINARVCGVYDRRVINVYVSVCVFIFFIINIISFLDVLLIKMVNPL
jgi:hypothetical protein